MDTSNLYVDHLAWGGFIAQHMVRQAGVVSSAAQENILR